MANALELGHSKLALLHEATAGSTTALTKIITSLEATAADTALRAEWDRLSAGPWRPVRKENKFRVRHEREVKDKRLQTPPKEGRHVLDPPVPGSALNGRPRRVPHHIVTSVGTIPMLRYKIGQTPPWLRRIVRQKQQWMLQSFEQSEELEHQRFLGLREDEWDRLLWKQAQQEGLIDADERRDAKRNSLSVGEWDYSEMVKGSISYSFWPQVLRLEHYETFLEKKWQNSVRGWELWQVVKREQWLADREAIPYRLARAIESAQRLQDDVQSWATSHGANFTTITPRTSNFRPRETSEAMRGEVLACAPLHIPVEWSERVVDKERPAYLQKPRDLQPMQQRRRELLCAGPGADVGQYRDAESLFPPDSALSAYSPALRIPAKQAARPVLPDGHPRARRRRDTRF